MPYKTGQTACTSFNPHPLRRADATRRDANRDAQNADFQSSSAPKSGCYDQDRLRGVGPPLFQSSSAPKSGCYPHVPARADGISGFQSSSAPKSGCYGNDRCRQRRSSSPFNPHPLRRADATRHRKARRCCGNALSILIRSEERMLPVAEAHAMAGAALSILIRSEERMLQSWVSAMRCKDALSILIRSEERMLPWLARLHRVSTSPFNPHPLRRADATCMPERGGTRCTSFNPHPLRRADATACSGVSDLHWSNFQSSSAPKSGCYPCILYRYNADVDLSILIRSEERMLQTDIGRASFRGRLSILIRSEERMLLVSRTSTIYAPLLSILIRSEERMLPDAREWDAGGCELSILIRSEERMLHPDGSRCGC